MSRLQESRMRVEIRFSATRCHEGGATLRGGGVTVFPQIQETVIQPGDDQTETSTRAPERHTTTTTTTTVSTINAEGQISGDFFRVDVAR